MFKLQNIKDFVDNPMGKGSMAIPNRQLIKDDLNRRYDKLVKEKKIEFDVYKNGEEYYFHFKIPSESERKNTYDIVLYFTMGEEDFKYDNFLNRYYLKFFSNCPSFIYTYAYAFNLHGMFIEDLSNKYNDMVLQNDSVIRNPGEVISYEKSVYFACRHLLVNSRYLNKMILNSIAKKYDANAFNKVIRHEDSIKLEIAKENSRLEKEKKEAEAKERDRKAGLNNKLKKAVTGNTTKEKISGNSTVNRIKPMKKIQPRKSSINKQRPK